MEIIGIKVSARLQELVLRNVVSWQEAQQVQAALRFVGKVRLIVSGDRYKLLPVLCRNTGMVSEGMHGAEAHWQVKHTRCGRPEQHM